jgi:diguanylate cyclase (GGDEF)-like protein
MAGLNGTTLLLIGVLLPLSVIATWFVIARRFGRQAVTASHRQRIALYRHSGVDLLTGLPNRDAMLDEIGHRLEGNERTGTPLAVIHLDIDDFKDVNDAFGHAAADELLIEFGARLAEEVGVDGVVGRTSSDEFTIATGGGADQSGCHLLVDRVLHRMQEPFPVSAVRSAVTVGVSLGIAEGWRAAPEDLLHDADVALSRAKCTGKSRAVRFTRSMQVAADQRRALESDLIDALASDQFFLLYQPTMSLETGRITGVEALLRWSHPVRGLVMPDEFIPSLESTGLIVPVGRWVLDRACAQAAKWNAGPDQVVMAVNVSGHQLEQSEFVADVAAALKISGLEPHLLSLELTETAVMQDVERSITRLEQLKATGVRLSVDDFGTGYSSIAYLQRFPIDVIKIDQSFVGRMTESWASAALVHVLVEMGKALGLETVAEGIETDAQLTMLRTEGVETGQGFLLARPIPPSEVELLLWAMVA